MERIINNLLDTARLESGTRGNLCVCSSCPRDGNTAASGRLLASGATCDGDFPAAWAASVRSIVYRLQRRVRDGFSPSSVTCAGTQ